MDVGSRGYKMYICQTNQSIYVEGFSFSFLTLDILSKQLVICDMSARPGRGIPPLWLFLRFLPSFFFFPPPCFSSLGSRMSFTVHIVKLSEAMWLWLNLCLGLVENTWQVGENHSCNAERGNNETPWAHFNSWKQLKSDTTFDFV